LKLATDALEKQSEEARKTTGKNGLSRADELTESTLQLTLEGAGHEAFDCMCEAVGSDKDSVTYQCKYEVKKVKKCSAARIEGSFAMNVP
jgi:hypothetical protein